VRQDLRNELRLLDAGDDLELPTTALTSITVRVVCVAGGFTLPQLVPFRKPHIRYSMEPVDLAPLIDAKLCITYAAEGTMMRFLLAGVPQLISPWHVESFMAAKRINAGHLGCAIGESPNPQCITDVVDKLASDGAISKSTHVFAAQNAARASATPAKIVAMAVDHDSPKTSKMKPTPIPAFATCGVPAA
jgi:UDP:flavonoid glycosyltransferase YjiC (YdhE family)